MKALRVTALLCSFLVPLWMPPNTASASTLTLSGNMLFSSLDGSAQDSDGTANGVLTVNGDLVLDGTINCNDDPPLPGSAGACPMRFAVSGNVLMRAGSGLFAENRRDGGNGGNISLTVGGALTLEGLTPSLPGAVISSGRLAGASGHSGDVSIDVSGAVDMGAGSTVAASTNSGNAGTIQITAGGTLQVAGLVASGPSRTLLASRWTGTALDGGSSGQTGGPIVLRSHATVGPALRIQPTANVVSQGEGGGGRLVLLEACGIEVRGLVASLSKNNGPSQVALRSGKGILVDGRDLGAAEPTSGRFGRVRGDGTLQGAAGYLVDLFADGDVQVLGPAAGSLVAVTSSPGTQGQRPAGGTITGISLSGGLTAAGNAFTTGRSQSGDQGGTIDLRTRGDILLDGATLRSIGDIDNSTSFRAGGVIAVRSYSGNVSWTFGVGDVRPTGSAILSAAKRGRITLTACGTIDITGSQFPVLGNPVPPFPVETEGVCSPQSPSLPTGEPALPVCNQPPSAEEQSATTKEDTAVSLTLTGSDPNSNPLTFSITAPPAHGTLGPLTSPTATSVQVVYTPDADFYGSDSFVFQVDDGQGGHDTATVSLTVTPVNDAPSFTAGPDQTVGEDAGAQTVSPWATAIKAGPANESGQAVNFQVTGNSNPGLFSMAPAVSSTGVLTYTPTPGATGTATISLVIHDDGGTADGGVDTSVAQTFTITVVAVNDPPSFVKGPDQTVNEDAGPQTVSPWATAISAGPPDEAGQVVSFLITDNTNPGLFAAGPAVSSSGVLTYTPAADANATATIMLVAKDNGGTANGGLDTSAPQTFTITVNAVNDAPSFTKGPDVTVLEDSGAHTIDPWATGISKGPADESGQGVSFHVTGNTNPDLFAAGPSIAPSGALSFTLAANAYGTSSISVVIKDDGGTANSGVDTSAAQMFTITVTPVNDAPSFTKGPDASAYDNSGPVTVSPWATGISAGPNESSQVLDFQVAGNSNSAIFSAGPSVSASGVLTFTPAQVPPGTSTATITLQLHDDGGTANGGIDTSGTQSFVISITHVNNPPHLVDHPKETFDTIGNTLLEVDGTPSADGPKVTVSGSLLVNFTDNDGPLDLSASLVSASAGASVTVDTDGTFTYLPAAGGTGDDTFTYSVTDGQDTVTRTVTVHRIGRVWYVKNDAAADGLGRSSDPFDTLAEAQTASAADDTIFVFAGDGTTAGQDAGIVLKNGQRLIGQGAELSLNVGLNGNAAPTKLLDAGDRPLLEGSNAVSATDAIPAEIAGLSLAGTANGIDVTTTGSFTGSGTLDIHGNVVRAAGLEGVDINAGGTGTLTLRVRQNDLTATGTGLDIQRTAGAMVISAFDGNTVREATGGSGIVITGPVTFDAVPGGALDPVSGGVTNIGIPGSGVGGAGLVVSGMSGTLAFNALGVFADGGAGVRVTGTGTATASLTVSSGMGTVEATGGPALDLSGLTMSLPQISLKSTNSASTGVALNSVTGNLSAGSGSSISNLISASGTAFQVGSSNATISYAGTITTTTGKGVELTNNTGSTIGFTGTLTLSTGANAAFTATGGGAVSATDTNSTLTTTTGMALNIQNATIGGSGLIFKTISAGTTASGPSSGIVLNNTGSSGSLTVNGGTIQKTSSHGVSLASTLSPSFDHLTIKDTAGSGIKGTGVNNFTFTNGVIANSGSATDDSNIAFNNSASGTESNLAGTVTITGNTLTNAFYHGIDIQNFNGSLSNFDVSGNTITSSTSAASSNGSGIRLIANGSATTVSNVARATISNNVISNFPSGSGIRVQGGNGNAAGPSGSLGTAGSAANIISVTGNRISGASAATKIGLEGILATVSGKGQGNFDISSNGTAANPIANVTGTAISINALGAATVTATASNNFIAPNNTFAANGIAAGVNSVFGTTDAPDLTVTITSNNISAVDGNGILAVARNSNGTLRAKVQNNTVAAPLSGVRPGIRVDSGTASGNTTVCLNISGNTSAGSGGSQGIGLRKQGTVSTTNAFGVNGMSATNSPAVEAYVDGLNPAGNGTLLLSATSGFTNCSFP
jgi:hypothetical protein